MYAGRPNGIMAPSPDRTGGSHLRELHKMPTHTLAQRTARLVLAGALLASAACTDKEAERRADSASAAAAEQLALATQLAAQKDSLMTIVLDADQFINQVDSTISRVRGLPKRERTKAAQAEGVLQEQLEFRRDMLFRVDALVKRAESTARQLAEARRRESGLRSDNAAMRDSLTANERVIAQLGETIHRQSTQIAELQTAVGQLTETNTRLSEELSVTLASSARVYYIIGREDDLLRKGVITREGGMNLLVARAGRTVQPARQLDAALFTSIDAREVSRIEVPDTTKEYRIVSRQSLDHAEVARRDESKFRGHLQITDRERFWAPSRYLIIVQR